MNFNVTFRLFFIIVILNFLCLYSNQSQTVQDDKQNKDPIETKIQSESEITIAAMAQQRKQQLSEYMGYLMWKSLRDKDFQYNLDQVIQGLKKAENGEYANLSIEKYKTLLIEEEKYHFKQKSEKNLSEANDFLKKIKNEEEVHEIEKDKLYFKKITSGKEIKIDEKDSGLFHINCYTLNKETITNTYVQNEPAIQNLENAIQGFKRGVSGMAEGEKRILYIHPDLAYGIFRNFEPNVLLISEVELIKILKPEY